jgi:predicted permease
MRRFFVRFVNLFRGRGAERELSREIESHLALLKEDFERRGLSPEEAARAARRAYGGVEQAKELHREARSFVWIEQLFKDVLYSGRNLLRNPGFTLVAVIALALGIGVNATIFGIYNAVALKQLPLADPSRVLRVKRWFGHNEYAYGYKFAYPEYKYLRGHNNVFSGLTAASSAISALASISGEADREHVSGYAVSANYFADLGVNARIGRTFLPDEDHSPGANPIVVLGYRFWQRKFHGDPNVIGQTIKLNGLSYTIVGVAPREFAGTDVFPTESGFWAPLSMIDQLDPEFSPVSDPASNGAWRERWRDTTHPGFQLLARLKNGVAPAQAQAETDLLIRQYLAGYRETQPTTAVTLQRTSYFGSTGDFWIHAFAAALLAIVSLVLLVACANVANMLLARGVARQREIAIRLALGAGRRRVIQQLLTESMLLSLLGGAAGVLVSVWAGRLLWASLITLVPGFREFHVELDLGPDAHVFIYGLALSVFTGILFGLAPALQSTRLDLYTAIKVEGSLLGATHGRSRLRGLLLGAQVTVAVLLLVVSGGLMGGLVSSFAKAADLGFETHDTYLVRISYGNDPAKAIATKQRLRERLETLPELNGVTIGGAPLQGTLPIQMAGNWNGETTATSFASDAYFETLGIRLLHGRGFTRQEADRGAPVAVISESVARRFWPNQDPLGKYFSLKPTFLKVNDFEVVGVAKDVRFAKITEIDPLHLYLPTGAIPRLLGGPLFRIRGNRDKALEAVRSAVESVDPSLLPSLDLVSLEDGPVAMQRGFFRVLAAFAGTLTVLSLALAGVGIYGVMAFLVSQRTREIGIRIALGATSRSVLKSVVIQGLRPVFMGALVGLAGSAWVTRLVRASEEARMLGLSARTFSDPALYAELALVLAIALLASVVPARRALRVDPVVALRYE